mmetsp:Transcript_42894/g.77175  ORF Transcript_42894/g.77175 Transcript_42894/m.77175 type:complete len:117 (-) Transcript_42894:597-947(-)
MHTASKLQLDRMEVKRTPSCNYKRTRLLLAHFICKRSLESGLCHPWTKRRQGSAAAEALQGLLHAFYGSQRVGVVHEDAATCFPAFSVLWPVVYKDGTRMAEKGLVAGIDDKDAIC